MCDVHVNVAHIAHIDRRERTVNDELRDYIYTRLISLRRERDTLAPYAGNAITVGKVDAKIKELELILRRF